MQTEPYPHAPCECEAHPLENQAPIPKSLAAPSACKTRHSMRLMAGEQIANTKSSDKKCGPRASHPQAASFVDLRSCLPPLRAAERRQQSGRARESAALTVAVAQTVIQNRRSPTPAAASSPTPAQRAGGEEAAMPGQPVRTHARSVSPGNSPSRITGLPLTSPQSSFRRASEGLTFSVHSLCGRSRRVATPNRFPLVQKL